MSIPDFEFSVSRLLQEPVGATRTHDIRPHDWVLGGIVELVRIPRGVLVRARLRRLTETECARCLEVVELQTGVEFDDVFHQQVEVVSGSRLEDEGEERDPDSFLISMDHRIDITEAVRQYSLMAATMQPLCRPDCPGLCSECGQDLRERECGCNRDPVDPRWAALAGLKPEQSE